MLVKILGSGSKGNCVIVQDDKKNQMLLDCGLPYETIIPNINFAKLDLLCSTHTHQDHIKSLKDFQKFYIPTYTNENVKDGEKIDTNNWIILPMKLVHNVECYGFIVYSKNEKKALAYITDTTYIPKISKVDGLIIDCNYSKEILQEAVARNAVVHQGYRNHLAVEDVAEYIKNLGNKAPKTLCAFHLSNSNLTNVQKVQEKLGGLTEKLLIAQPNLKFEL